MYDAKKIIPALIIFMVLATIPIWYSAVRTEAKQPPDWIIVTGEEQCVEPGEYMRENHMELLEEWRESAVRDGVRTYQSSDGKEYEISLTGTCLGCHSNKADFCDRCHNYVEVQPGCWDCHNIPGDEK